MSYARSPIYAGGGIPLTSRLYSIVIAPPVILALVLLLTVTELVALVSRCSSGSARPMAR